MVVLRMWMASVCSVLLLQRNKVSVQGDISVTFSNRSLLESFWFLTLTDILFLKIWLLFEHEWCLYSLSFLVISFLLPKKYLEKMEVHSSLIYCLFDYRKELKEGVIFLLCFNYLYQVQSSCCSLLFPIIAFLQKCPPPTSLWCLQFKPCNLILIKCHLKTSSL